MTGAGFTRLLNIFVNDIASIKYDLDSVEQTVTNFTNTINNNVLTLFIDIPDNQNGLFDNFRIIGTTNIVYTERNIVFNKTSDGLEIEIPFMVVNG